MPPGSNFTSDSDRESILALEDVAPQPRRNSTGPKYFCSIPGCNEQFKRLDHLDRHEFYHTGIKRHACSYDDCGKVYSILTHLKRHLRCTHERTAPAERNIPCSIKDCNKMFQSHFNMNKHVREVHENPKIYNCTYCEETFTQKLKMRRHEINKHTGEYPFNCEKCSKGFYQKWQYEKHTPSCKIYNCSNCSEQFDKWTNYLKHCKEKQHGRKYYKCEDCSRVYAKPSELKRHMMAKHVDDDKASSFKCTHEDCDRVYAYERNLRQHVKTAHSGKRFECSEKDCQSCFSSAQNLAKHVKREHLKGRRQEESSTDAVDAGRTIRKRKKRKDAGTSVVSNLATLSGIAIDRQFDKLLRSRETEALAKVSAELALNSIDEEEGNLSESNGIKMQTTLMHTESVDITDKKHDDRELNELLTLVLQE